MRTLLVITAIFSVAISLSAAEPCVTFHGRAHYYGGDGQLRIWRIGTHHEFEPDSSTWSQVISWLEAGVPPVERKNYASPASAVNLFADFEVCPTEPLRKGAVQEAKIMSATHRHYVRTD
ncbi:MAG: hypothetical protein WCF17_00530 [Terracidiphilus sp.]